MSKDQQPSTEERSRTGDAPTVRILIADDHAVLREGLKRILSELAQRVETGEAGTTQETIELLSRESWDLLILDIFMPGRGGLEVLAEVRQQFPHIPVLVLSSAPEDQLAVRVLRAGADGYLNKQSVPEELLLAARKIQSGGKYFSSRLAEKLVREFGEPQAAHERLSDREFRVMRLIAEGKSIKEIAAELSLSPKTVTTFHGRILQKLHLRNDVQLAHYALEHCLLEKENP